VLRDTPSFRAKALVASLLLARNSASSSLSVLSKSSILIDSPVIL
jgi:hypothetical protein